MVTFTSDGSPDESQDVTEKGKLGGSQGGMKNFKTLSTAFLSSRMWLIMPTSSPSFKMLSPPFDFLFQLPYYQICIFY